jgi:hypothetical protein
MRKNVLLLVVSLALVFTGCNKTKTDIDSTARSLELNTDLTSLAERFVVVNEPIEWTNYIYKSSQLSPVTFVEAWRLLPFVDANNDTLSASSVDVANGMVYVGSHMHEYTRPDFTVSGANGGEIAVVDANVSNTNGAAALVVSAYDPLVDYNDIEITAADPNNLWIAGENFDRGSVILRMDIATNTLSPTLEMSIFGSSGNSITVSGNDLWVSSATSTNIPGGLLAINKNYPAQTNHSSPVPQAKQFDATGDYGVLLYGESSTMSHIRVYDMHNLYSFVDYPLAGFDVTDLGKNAVDISQEYAYLAMGDDGVIKVNLTNGIIEQQFLNFGKGNANGVKVDGAYAYVAYGQGGFYLLDKSDLSAVGHWDTEYSCNYVGIDPGEPILSNHVYLANGRANLICLERVP